MIEIETNALELKDFLSHATRKQMPFAVSKAVNMLASNARKDERTKLDQYFDIRTSYMMKAQRASPMPIIASDKRQFPEIFAILAVRDEVAALNATGGQRKASGGEKLGVPLSKTVGGVSTRAYLNPSKGTLGPPRFPERILKKVEGKRRKRPRKAAPFKATTKKGVSGIWVREGKGRYPIRPIYIFKRAVDIPKNWPLVENVESFVRKKYGETLSYELRKALEYKRR